MDQALIPLIIFGSIPLTVWIVLLFKSRNHAKTAETLKELINKDVELTPEILKSLPVTPTRRRHRDLRIGLFLTAISLASVFFGNLIPEDEAKTVFLGIAAFPFFVGCVYLGLWGFITRKDE